MGGGGGVRSAALGRRGLWRQRCGRRCAQSSRGHGREGGGHGAHAGVSSSKREVGRSHLGEHRQRGVGRGRWGGGEAKTVGVCLGSSWSHTGLHDTTTLRQREKIALECVSPGAHDRGGALRLGTQYTESIDFSLPSSDQYLRFRSANGHEGRTQSTLYATSDRKRPGFAEGSAAYELFGAVITCREPPL